MLGRTTTKALHEDDFLSYDAIGAADEPAARAFVSTRFRLDGQVAVVTGACGKLGPVWVDALLEAGARVAALDLPSAQASPAFADLAARVADAVLRVDCDITAARVDRGRGAGRREPRWARRRCSSTTPASTSRPTAPAAATSWHDLPIDTFRRMVEVNLLGTFQVTQVFGALMAAARAARSSTSVPLRVGVAGSALLRSPGRQRAVHQVAGVRRVEGRRGQPVEVLRHPLGRAPACA